MNVELTRVLVEARTLAQERGWSRTADAADAALASAPANALLLVSPPDVDFGGLPRWIKETAPQLEIAKTGTEALAANPLAAGEAERVVAVFECGKLMTADAVEIVQRVCFSRPDGSYAIILRGAESLENPEEREILERGVFRLLVPDPKGEWFGQDLLHRGCYLWCDGSAPAFLAEKIERDRAALGDWLRRPARHGDALAIQQALEMLDLADRELDGSPKSAAEEPLLTPTRLFIAVNDMSELRRRLTARVDAEAPSIERQLGASLQTLEQDLLQGARAYVLPRLPQFDPSRDQSRLTAVVTEYIAAAAREWKARAEQILGTRSHELQSDLDTVLHGLDWRVANAACESVGEPGGYPDALLENLAPAQGAAITLDGPVLEFVSGDRRRKNAAMICGLLATAAIGRGVVMLGLGPIGVAAVGVGAVAQLVKYRDDSARACHEFARAAIQSTFRATIQDVQHHVREGLKPVRSGISERLRSLEATLDGALANLRAAESAAPAEDPDRAAIAALRARVVALIPTPQPSAAGVAADAESRASTGTDAVEEIASNRSPGGETRDDPPTVRL